MKIGSELTAKVISQASAGLLKIKRTLIDALPRSKAESLSKSERASTARKKKREGAKGKASCFEYESGQSNPFGSMVERCPQLKLKRPFNGRSKPGTAVARGLRCMILADRRKQNKRFGDSGMNLDFYSDPTEKALVNEIMSWSKAALEEPSRSFQRPAPMPLCKKSVVRRQGFDSF